jgi:hypothetical protein
VNSGERRTPFEISRRGRFAEPHVVIVHSLAVLSAKYNLEGADVIEVPYAGGGWGAFTTRACAKVGLTNASLQIFTETMFDRALGKPVVIFVPNAQALLNDSPEDLLRYILLWETFAFDRRDEACPMFLALQMPDPKYD